MTSVEVAAYGFKTISALALVLGVLIASAFIVKKLMRRSGAGPSGDMIHVLASHYIGPKSSIMVVEILKNVFVIGVSNSQMSLLGSIEGGTLNEEFELSRKREDGGTSFLKHLSRCSSEMLARRFWAVKDESSNA